MISDETRARVEQLLDEAPPLTPEQITAAVAILARPKPAKAPTPARRSRRRTPATSGQRAEGRRAA